MKLNKEEIKYCNLARAFLNDAYDCLLMKNLLDASFVKKLNNIFDIEQFMETKEFEIICGASLVSPEFAKKKLKRNIESLEKLMKHEAREFLVKKLVACNAESKYKKKKVGDYLKSDIFYKICKIADFDTFDVIEVYEERGII